MSIQIQPSQFSPIVTSKVLISFVCGIESVNIGNGYEDINYLGFNQGPKLSYEKHVQYSIDLLNKLNEQSTFLTN